MSPVFEYLFPVARWFMAFLSIGLVVSWTFYFIKTKKQNPPLCALVTSDGLSIPINVAEAVLGRSKPADIIIPIRGVEKRHALLTFEKGRFKIAPLDGKVYINLQNLSRPAPLEFGDKITIAGQTLSFKSKSGEDISSESMPTGILPLFILTVFQVILCLMVYLRFYSTASFLVPASFILLVIGQWCYFFIGRAFKNFKMLFEIPILYLSTLGLTVTICAMPEQLLKQIICFIAGFVLFLILTFLLKFKEFIVSVRHIIMAVSLVLLYFTAFFGTKINNSRNWLEIGSFSFQPSELAKVAFIAAGGITLYIIHTKPAHRLEFLIYSFLSMGSLAIMLDFGAVAIFFAGMLIILALRLEKPIVIGGITFLAVAGATGVILLYPYIARRFGAWLHAWEYAGTSGYQQTRTMMYFASGGALGVGPGNGHLTSIAASETDLVFGVLGEELGGIVALTAVLCIVALGLYGFRLVKHSIFAFYAITVGGAASMILFQSALNIFGSVDMLPLTGVTFIFVSVGGSSLISAWLMLSFFKSAELHGQALRFRRDSR